MIAYIFISYVIMFLWFIKWQVLDRYLGLKYAFKQLLIAPISLPLNIIRKFNEW